MNLYTPSSSRLFYGREKISRELLENEEAVGAAHFSAPSFKKIPFGRRPHPKKALAYHLVNRLIAAHNSPLTAQMDLEERKIGLAPKISPVRKKYTKEPVPSRIWTLGPGRNVGEIRTEISFPTTPKKRLISHLEGETLKSLLTFVIILVPM